MPPTARSAREFALDIVRVLQGAGHEAYFVGGCVRDLLLGRTPQDYDIATSASPAEVQRLFACTKTVGRKFGVMLVIERPRFVQVATFQGELGDQPAAGSGLAIAGTTRTDAARRDFTINALFLDPVTGTLRDWVGGQADLRARLVRTVGRPEDRLAEDPLRLLRAVRLAAQLEFTIEASTLKAIRAHATELREVSAERLREELVRIFLPAHAARGLALLHETGLLNPVLPEASLAASLADDASGTAFNGLCRDLARLPSGAPGWLPWVVLLQGIAKLALARDTKAQPEASEPRGGELAGSILKRLRFSTAQTRQIVAEVHQRLKSEVAA